MKDVALKVSPLSRKVLLSEYGYEQPIVIRNKDLMYKILTSAPLKERSNITSSIPFLTDTICIAIHSDVANWLFTRPYHPGALLYQLHKELMCRYALAAVRRNGEAWKAIQEWLYLHDIEEEDYGMEAAYKCWQRWNKKFLKKNPQFFSRIKQKPSAKSAKNEADFIRVKMAMPQCEIEAALERFLIDLEVRMRRVPKRLPAHARAWFYKEYGGLSEREVSSIIGMHRASVGYGHRSMQNWIDTNPKIARALAQVTGLPQCA